MIQRTHSEKRQWQLAVSVSVGCLMATFPSVASFVSPKPRCIATRTLLWSTAECETSVESSIVSPKSTKWLNKGLLLSSFTDGLQTNPPAIEWLMNALVETLWKEEQERSEKALKQSNLVSPCNGPDPVLLDKLESMDSVVEGMQTTKDWNKQLKLLFETTQQSSIDLRVLYIPTAMYALRPGSTSKPGKQRGRNRADGKQRRDRLMNFLEEQLQGFVQDVNSESSFTINTITLDFDDASVKQPQQVVVGNTSNDESFPKTGKEAIREWKPHLVYVQGGNTFWLHHCMETGDWQQDLINACCTTSIDENVFSAVYCGVSAGAILAGESMQTACWKEWDDPSVVPNKESYRDWNDTKGLDATGKVSWFPHMTEEWQEMTNKKTKILLESSGDDTSSVTLIRDDQAYAVDGRTQSITELL